MTGCGVFFEALEGPGHSFLHYPSFDSKEPPPRWLWLAGCCFFGLGRRSVNFRTCPEGKMSRRQEGLVVELEGRVGG